VLYGVTENVFEEIARGGWEISNGNDVVLGYNLLAALKWLQSRLSIYPRLNGVLYGAISSLYHHGCTVTPLNIPLMSLL
jgi:hypothetical protein